MKQKAIMIDMDDIVARDYNGLIFLEKNSTGGSLGSANVTILDGGYSGLIRVKYRGLEETANAGQGEEAAKRLAHRYHSHASD